MPIGYVIDRTRRLVISTAEGRVSFDEIKAQVDRLLDDSAFDPTFNQLIDCSEITNLDLSVDEAKMIGRLQVFSQTSRHAFVATKPAVFGMARLIQAYHEQYSNAEARVFDERDSALKWLGDPGSLLTSQQPV